MSVCFRRTSRAAAWACRGCLDDWRRDRMMAPHWSHNPTLVVLEWSSYQISSQPVHLCGQTGSVWNSQKERRPTSLSVLQRKPTIDRHKISLNWLKNYNYDSCGLNCCWSSAIFPQTPHARAQWSGPFQPVLFSENRAPLNGGDLQTSSTQNTIPRKLIKSVSQSKCNPKQNAKVRHSNLGLPFSILWSWK